MYQQYIKDPKPSIRKYASFHMEHYVKILNETQIY